MTSLSLLTGGEVSESTGSWECGRNGSGKGEEEEIAAVAKASEKGTYTRRQQV
jgi:hypothetical protein